MKLFFKTILSIILSINILFVKADEGMWLPMLLGEATYKTWLNVECV